MNVSHSSPVFRLISILLLLALSLPFPTFSIQADTYDFVASANLASGSSAAGSLGFPGVEADERGFAPWKDKVKMEEGSQSPRVLESHLQWVTNGWIAAIYPAFTVPANAMLELTVGFFEGATGSNGVLTGEDASDTAFQIVTSSDKVTAPTQSPVPGIDGSTLRTILMAIAIGGGLLILIVALAVILGRRKKG